MRVKGAMRAERTTFEEGRLVPALVLVPTLQTGLYLVRPGSTGAVWLGSERFRQETEEEEGQLDQTHPGQPVPLGTQLLLPLLVVLNLLWSLSDSDWVLILELAGFVYFLLLSVTRSPGLAQIQDRFPPRSGPVPPPAVLL